MDQTQKLRIIASWFRKSSMRTTDQTVADGRLRTALYLEREVGDLESQQLRDREHGAFLARLGRAAHWCGFAN
jgi:hypothetical protein